MSQVEGLSVVLVLYLLPTSLLAQVPTNFIFNKFNVSTLELYGNASVQSNHISLNQPSQYSMGRASYPHPMRMKDPASLHSTLSFTITFVFSIVPSSETNSGHAMAFIMTPHRSPEGFLPGPYLGLISNLSVMGEASNHLFAVEFDTTKNYEVLDINGNHFGVDLNNLIS